MPRPEILVHLRRHDGTPPALSTALTLARTLGARLTGLYIATIAPAAFAAPEAVAMQMLESNREFDAAAARASWWQTQLATAGVEGDWQVAQGDPVEALCHAARWCDLVVAERAVQHPDAPLGWGVVSRTVFGGGRPVVVLPEGARPLTALGTVAVAWNGSPEAIRALHGARALLAAAGRVVVLRGREHESPMLPRQLPRFALEDWLTRQGVTAEVRPFDPGDADAGSALLAAAHAASADLLVMGAWGHSRIAQLVLGGATRHLFQHSDLPLLVAH